MYKRTSIKKSCSIKTAKQLYLTNSSALKELRKELLSFLGTTYLVLLYFMCFLSTMSSKLDIIFIELQQLYNHCLYKLHLVVCDFVLTLQLLFYGICKTIKIGLQQFGFAPCQQKRHASKVVLSRKMWNKEQSQNVIKKKD